MNYQDPFSLGLRNDFANNFNYLSLIFPFGINESLDKDVLSLIEDMMPVFDMVIGI